jgi:hypothetical protein
MYLSIYSDRSAMSGIRSTKNKLSEHDAWEERTKWNGQQGKSVCEQPHRQIGKSEKKRENKENKKSRTYSFTAAANPRQASDALSFMLETMTEKRTKRNGRETNTVGSQTDKRTQKR